MAENSVGLLASLLSPAAARASQKQQSLQNILSMAGSRNPLLAEAGKTAGMFSQSLGRFVGTDMRSEAEKSAEKLSNAVTTASGETLYDKMISAAKNPELSIQERYVLMAQAQKIKPEKKTISAENFLDPSSDSYFRGITLDTGDVLNLETRQIVPNALTAGDVKKEKPEKPKEPKDAKPVEYQPFDDDTLGAALATSKPLKSAIEQMAQEPNFWGKVKDFLGYKVGESLETDEATYDNLVTLINNKAKEIQKQAAKDPKNPRTLTADEALRAAITAMRGGDFSGIAPIQVQGRDKFAGKVRAQ
jgi:hypothetical protein